MKDVNEPDSSSTRVFEEYLYLQFDRVVRRNELTIVSECHC
jgi:hypothetical protein